MNRELRQTHFRVWLILGPILLAALFTVLLTRGSVLQPVPTQAQAPALPVENP